MSRRQGTKAESSESGCKALEWESIPWVNPRKKQDVLKQIEKLEHWIETATPEQKKGNIADAKRKKARLVAKLKDVENNGERDRGGLERAKVPGGWLVRTYDKPVYQDGGAASMTFVPDPNYEWK